MRLANLAAAQLYLYPYKSIMTVSVSHHLRDIIRPAFANFCAEFGAAHQQVNDRWGATSRLITW